MSKTPPKSPRASFDDIDLMLYVDGEADARTAEAVAAGLGADPSGGDGDPGAAARRKVEALDEMGELVRSYLELEADQAEPALDGLWAGIERRIQANGVPDSAPAPAPAEPGLWTRVRQWLEASRGYFATGALAAAAATILVVALRPPEVKIVERPVAATPGPTEPRMVPVSTPPEVEEIEVSGGSASVFTLEGEGEDEVSAGVIWLDLDLDEQEGPIL
ncbi:hypothetical protein [Haliangium sp.]|uniref:hypothetical protein n=1 Tax=Haliangium sp. TaxID=2663208 RepID=UPI003D0E39F4